MSSALGDNLLLSFLVREIKSVSPGTSIAIETKWPDLFNENPYVDAVFDKKFSIKYHKIKYFIDAGTTEHMMDQMIRQLPFAIHRWNRKVDLFLNDDECKQTAAQLPPRYVVVNPYGKQRHSANRKEWGTENFQRVRDLLPELDFVQIGTAGAPRLKNTIDFTGTSVRESAIIIKGSMTGLFLEGGLMHLANAVNRPCVIIYGGAIAPSISGYDMHTNLYCQTACSPCFTSHEKLTACTTMHCMKAIRPDQVAHEVMKLTQMVKRTFHD